MTIAVLEQQQTAARRALAEPTTTSVPSSSPWFFVTMPRGIILHSTRSGRAYTELQEFHGTLGWVRRGAAGLGWNATIGPGVLGLHLPPRYWGWNAREHSSVYLAIEFAQARPDQHISDAQIDAAAWWIVHYALEAWPDLPLTAASLPFHSELAAGARDFKSDAFAFGDPAGAAFRQKLLQRVAESR